MEKKFTYILIVARESTPERNRQIIDQLARINNFTTQYKVFLYTNSPVRPSYHHIHQIRPEESMQSLMEQGDVLFDLVVIEDMKETDIPFVTFMMRNQIPIFALEEMIEQFPRYLIPSKTVIPYSDSPVLQLPLSIVQFLRNHIQRRNFLIEAQRMANAWDVNGCPEKLLILTTEPVVYPSLEAAHIVKEESETDSGSVDDPVVQNPMVDLVIINYNTLSYLKQCIFSIMNNTNYPHQIIVVDNGSTDGSQAYLHRLPNVKTVLNKENLGYAAACNQGIAAGQGEFVVVLNSDIIVHKGWLTSMVLTAQRDPEIGVVGPKMVNEQGLIVGVGVTELTSECAPRGWLKPDRDDLYNQQEDCYSVGGACYLIRREALKRTGAFDENYFFYFEETDLSLRMLEKGYRVVYCPDAKVLHFHEGSLNPDRPDERLIRNQYFLESQKRFLAKWKEVFDGSTIRTGHRDIVVFGVIPWDFRYQRPQQILTRLAKNGYRVLYINSHCVRGGAFKEVSPNIYTFSPDGESLVYHVLSLEQGCRDIVRSIYRIFKQMNIDQPILWVDVPYWQTILWNFDRQMLVYNCMDSYIDFSDIKRHCPQIEELEKELCQETDLIFTSSLNLQEKILPQNPSTYLIQNGADLEFFSPDQYWEMPKDLRNISQPIAGYYGAIAEWFDHELVYEVAKQLPEVSFVFIGHQTVNVDRLRSLKNVFFLGEKSYFDLPKYLAYFQVALIPFKINTLTLSTNPVKIYEYLAHGKPVVSVTLPELQQFSEVIYFADDPDLFASSIEEGLCNDGWWPRRKRMKAVEHDDWAKRVTDIMERIREYEDLMKFQSKFPELERAKKCR